MGLILLFVKNHSQSCETHVNLSNYRKYVTDISLMYKQPSPEVLPKEQKNSFHWTPIVKRHCNVCDGQNVTNKMSLNMLLV